MTSKTKKKSQGTKKVRRRASVGNTNLNESHSSNDFGTSASVIDMRAKSDKSHFDLYGPDDSSKKMVSARTMATEGSSSHHSPDLGFRSPKTKTPKKGKKSKSMKEIDGQWWHIDDNGSPTSKAKKKKKDVDRLSQTEHAPSNLSVMTPLSVKKKKKKAKSVKHLSTSNLDSGSDGKTVNTTGTGSLRPKPKSARSLPGMIIEDPPGNSPHRSSPRQTNNALQRTPSGSDLDMLMSQNVNAHVRRTPKTGEKPKLGKSNKTVVQKIGKKIGKSCKALGISAKSLNISTHKNGPSNVSERSGRDTSIRENASASMRSYKPLPKDIREIDGVLWRVDEYGNKLNKVRRKTQNRRNSNASCNETGSLSSYTNCASDDDLGDSFSSPKPKRKGQRRSSMGSYGKYSPSYSPSQPMPPASDRSIYTEDNRTPSTPKNTRRSKSMDHASPHQTPRRATKASQEVVQNLQHRLQNSEKEIAQLCRVSIEQQEKIEISKNEVKNIREKLQFANRDKQSLILQVETLKLQIEKRKDRSNKSLNSTSTDELKEQICDLEDEKEFLEKELSNEKTRAERKFQAKEGEVRFLQKELERMRSENGNKQFEYMKSMAVDDDDDASICSTRSASRKAGDSLRFVGALLGNHLKDKAETEVALQKEEIKSLQARVFALQKSNEKLNAELKKATLEIRADDDDDVRAAKEAAAKAAELKMRQHPKKDLKSKVMSLSRIHRTNSDADGDSALSLSFRGGVGDSVRSGRTGSPDERLTQSFRGGTSRLY